MLAHLHRALRTLARTPVFTASAILLLAVTIGATTAVLAAVDTVLFGALPYARPDRLVVMGEREIRSGFRVGTSVAAWLDLQSRLTSLDGLAAVETELTCRSPAGTVPCARVSANFFEVLGVSAVAGRRFGAAEGRAGADAVMAGEEFWREHLAARPLERAEIDIAGRRRPIVGVVPRDFRVSYAKADVWLPIEAERRRYNRADRSLRLVGRLAPGASLEALRAELDAAGRDFAIRYPSTEQGWTPWALGMRAFTMGERAPLAALLAAIVGIVLVVACFNLAALNLAHTVVRRREFAIARVVGAAPWRAAAPVVTESLILSAAGACAGAALTWTLRQAAIASVPELRDLAINPRVLSMTAAVAVAVAVLASAGPAWLASRLDVAATLRGGADPPGAGRFRGACLGLQAAGAVALLVAAIGLTGGLARLTNTEAGFEAAHVIGGELTLPPALVAGGTTRQATCDRLEHRLLETGRVDRVACASSLPFFGVSPVEVSGDAREVRVQAARREVSPGYFAVLHIPVSAGRDFDHHDDVGSPRVAIVSQRLARELWPAGSPIGRAVRVDGTVVTVVGMVGDVRSVGLRLPVVAEIYRPLGQSPAGPLAIAVLGPGEPLALVPDLRDAVNDLSPEAALSYVNSMSALVAEQSALVKWLSAFATSFAALGLLLVAVGVNGTAWFFAVRRTREIGIRLALGSSRRAITRLVAAGALRPIALGSAAGAALGLAGSRVIASLLLDAAPAPIVAAATAVAGVTAVTALATWWPAARAARLDPSSALREP